MKNKLIYIILFTFLIIPVTPTANAAIKAGASCKKEKQIVISNSYLYQCKKIYKKLVWKKGSKVIIEPPGLVIDGQTPVPTSPSTPVPTSPSTPVPTSPSTVSQSNAVLRATSYLRTSSFSRSGLIRQLEFEGFSNADAIYGVDKQNADWRAQAVLRAQSYLRSSAFSRSGLIRQLEYEGFSNSDSVNGVDKQNTDWNAQAVLRAQSYLRSSAFSRSGLIRQLEYEGFTNEQAIFGVNATGL
jgi:hypothetical protein